MAPPRFVIDAPFATPADLEQQIAYEWNGRIADDEDSQRATVAAVAEPAYAEDDFEDEELDFDADAFDFAAELESEIETTLEDAVEAEDIEGAHEPTDVDENEDDSSEPSPRRS